MHEWTHYKHLDMIWSLIRCICLAVWWFHPLVWIAFFMSVRDSELACDEGVLLTVGEKERKAYGYMLLELCKDSAGRRFAPIPTLAAEMIGGKGEMRDRITLITRKAHHSILLAFCTVILAVLACGCTFGRESVKTGNTALAEEKNKTALEKVEKESYYTTHTEEEIRKDVEKQIGVLGKNSSKWLLQTELDAKDNPLRDDKRGIVRMETMSPRVYDKYTVSDLDQNGRLELISYDTDTRQVQIFEINEKRNGLMKCRIEGDASNSNVLADTTIPRAFFEEKTGVWHYHLLNCDMYKKGDTLSITKDTETGGRNYYHGMAPAYCHVSWFQKTYQYTAEEYESERVYKYYTKEELVQMLKISADEFMLRRTADEGIDYEKIYTDYAKSLWEKDKKMKYAAIVNSVQPVLLVTDFVIGETVSSGRDGANASDAEVYGYDREKNEVVSIGHINSTGSGYPVLSDGIWLEVGAHHGSERIFVDDGKGYHEMLVGYGRLDPEEHPTAEYDKICPFNEGTEGDKEKIPYYMADMLDLYRWGEEDTETVNSTGTPVQFTQIKSDAALESKDIQDLKAGDGKTYVCKNTVGENEVYITSSDAEKNDEEHSPFISYYEGIYAIEVYREGFCTDKRKILYEEAFDHGERLFFPKTFSFSTVDYNEDGNLDFALGTYVSSNYYEYRFYSVSEDGRITELLDENGNAADIISGHLGVSPAFEYQNKTISYESYDQKNGKYIKKMLRLK